LGDADRQDGGDDPPEAVRHDDDAEPPDTTTRFRSLGREPLAQRWKSGAPAERSEQHERPGFGIVTRARRGTENGERDAEHHGSEADQRRRRCQASRRKLDGFVALPRCTSLPGGTRRRAAASHDAPSHERVALTGAVPDSCPNAGGGQPGIESQGARARGFVSSRLHAQAVGWIAWATVNDVGQDFLRIVSRLVLARLVWPEDFGLFTLAFTVVLGVQVGT